MRAPEASARDGHAHPPRAVRASIPLLRIVGGDPRRANGTAAPDEPGVRWTRVMLARARVAVGFYDRPHVRAALAAAVLRELEGR